MDNLETRIKSAKDEGKDLRWTLSFDEMDIKTAIEYDAVTEQVYGCIDYGDGDQSNRTLAKQVLVFYFNSPGQFNKICKFNVLLATWN